MLERTVVITRCPTCGSKKIKRVRRTLTRQYRDQIYSVPDLEFEECPDCGERLFDHFAMQKFEKYSLAYAKKRKATRTATGRRRGGTGIRGRGETKRTGARARHQATR